MNITKLGNSGYQVRILQRDLVKLGYSIKKIDGSFGQETLTALKAFQTSQNFTSDGVAGDETWNKLDYLVPNGIDTYHKSLINWANLSPRIKYIYAKTTEGLKPEDTAFQSTVQKCIEKDILIGNYHFLIFQNCPGKLQAQNFLTASSNAGIDYKKPGFLIPYLDVEDQVGISPSDTEQLNRWVANNPKYCIQIIQNWLDEVEGKTGVTPGIYTYSNFIKEYLLSTEQFGRYPLWQASYQQMEPGYPPGWSKRMIWQEDDIDQVDGIDGECDLDIFEGNLDELKLIANIK